MRTGFSHARQSRYLSERERDLRCGKRDAAASEGRPGPAMTPCSCVVSCVFFVGSVFEQWSPLPVAANGAERNQFALSHLSCARIVRTATFARPVKRLAVEDDDNDVDVDDDDDVEAERSFRAPFVRRRRRWRRRWHLIDILYSAALARVLSNGPEGEHI